MEFCIHILLKVAVVLISFSDLFSFFPSSFLIFIIRHGVGRRIYMNSDIKTKDTKTKNENLFLFCLWHIYLKIILEISNRSYISELNRSQSERLKYANYRNKNVKFQKLVSQYTLASTYKSLPSI